MDNKNILLIGGTGTLGKVVLEELYKKGFNIGAKKYLKMSVFNGSLIGYLLFLKSMS